MGSRRGERDLDPLPLDPATVAQNELGDIGFSTGETDSLGTENISRNISVQAISKAKRYVNSVSVLSDSRLLLY